MRILFVVADGGGNIPPQLGVARALRRRGARVQFLGHREIRRQIEADDFEFEEFASATPTKSTQQRSLLRLMSDFARAATDLSIGDEVLAVARRDCADIVIVDVLLNAAVSKVAASEFRTVVFVHCFYRMVQDLAGGPIGLLLRLRGIDLLDAERANGFIDQERVGSVLEANDAGLLLPKHARVARIRAAIEKVLGEPRYRASAGRLGDQIRRVDGAEVAADSVTRFAGVLG